MPPTRPPAPLLARVNRVLAARPDDPDGCDARLLARFRDHRDPDAFAGLLARHGPLVAAVCRRVAGDPHLADDAFQATFLVLARRAAAVRPPGAVRGWLYGVAVRTARSARVRAARRRWRERPVAAVPDRPAPDHTPTDADALRILDEEIGRLPERLRAAVVLCELGGTSRRAAAARLAVPEGTVSSRLATARRVLAGRLRARGVAAGVLGALFTRAAAAPAAVPPAVDAAALLTSTGVAARVAAEAGRGALAGKARAGLLAAVALAGGLIAAGPAEPSTPPRDSPPAPTVPRVTPLPELATRKVPPSLPAVPPPDPVLEAHLAAWEKETAALTNVRADFTRTRADAVFKDVRAYEGSVLFMSPNLARVRFDNTKNKADFEAYIWDGSSVYEYSGLKKTIIEFPLPTPKRVGPPAPLVGPPAPEDGWGRLLALLFWGWVIEMWDRPPMLFLKGVTAKGLTDRFDIRLFKEDPNYVYLEFGPRTSADKMEFELVRVALIRPTAGPPFVPYALADVWVRMRNGDEERWRFSNVTRDVPGITKKLFAYEPVPGFTLQRARR